MSQKPKQTIRQNLKHFYPHKKTQNTNVLGFLRLINAFIGLSFLGLSFIQLYSGMMLNKIGRAHV